MIQNIPQILLKSGSRTIKLILWNGLLNPLTLIQLSISGSSFSASLTNMKSLLKDYVNYRIEWQKNGTK